MFVYYRYSIARFVVEEKKNKEKYKPDVQVTNLLKETDVAVGERIAQWICTPQIPVQDSMGTVHFLDHHHNSIIKLSVCWCVWKVRIRFCGCV